MCSSSCYRESGEKKEYNGNIEAFLPGHPLPTTGFTLNNNFRVDTSIEGWHTIGLASCIYGTTQLSLSDCQCTDNQIYFLDRNSSLPYVSKVSHQISSTYSRVKVNEFNYKIAKFKCVDHFGIYLDDNTKCPVDTYPYLYRDAEYKYYSFERVVSNTYQVISTTNIKAHKTYKQYACLKH